MASSQSPGDSAPGTLPFLAFLLSAAGRIPKQLLTQPAAPRKSRPPDSHHRNPREQPPEWPACCALQLRQPGDISRAAVRNSRVAAYSCFHRGRITTHLLQASWDASAAEPDEPIRL